jgi:Heterokaryon incompatibility protein (HET)
MLEKPLKSSQAAVQNDVAIDTIFDSFGHLPPVRSPPTQVMRSAAHLAHDEWFTADHGQGLPPVRVPFLGKLYNGKCFGSYPEFRGQFEQLQKPFPADPIRSKSLKDENEMFYQEWLFFGTLVEVFHALSIDIRQEDFIHTDPSGAKWITTTPLKAYLNNVALGVSWHEDSLASHQRQIGTIRECLAKVNEITNRTVIIGGVTYRAMNQLVRPEIFLSFQILGSTLENAIPRLLLDRPNISKDERGTRLNWLITDFLNSRLLQNGICPYTITRIERDFRPDALYFLSLLHFPPTEEEHSGCNSSDCKFEIVDEESYEPRHLESNCTCGYYVTVDSTQLCAILENGQIPILQIEPHSRFGSSIVVTAATPGTDYIAISHVWSDKMGNVKSNSIRGCMFKHLEGLIATIGHQERLTRGGKLIPFWIDTLCVPVEPKLHKYRKQAIRLMRHTYQSAARVLVLDGVLQWIPVPLSEQELLLRIVTGKWYRRLWTFQECALANELCFACSNGIVNGERLLEFMHNSCRSDALGFARAASCLDRDSQWAYLRTRFAYKGTENAGDTGDTGGPGIRPHDHGNFLAFLLASCADRKTTKPGDESICLASLMDFQMEDILEAEGDNKMKLFYSKCNLIPPGILFHYGPRIEDCGFQWAPRSFLGHASRDFRNIAGLGETACPRDDTRGLKVPYRIFVLKSTSSNAGTHFETPPTRRIFVKDIFSSTWHMVTIITTGHPEEAFSPPLIPKLDQPALIIRWWAPSEYSNQSVWLQQGALVSIQNEETQKEIFAKYESVVQVRELTRREYDTAWADKKWPFLEAAMTGVNIMDSERVILEAVRLPEDIPFWVA